MKEWFASYGQLSVSSDNMNLIQVGRPAVSRYHQLQRWYLKNQGPDHQVHDLPTAHLGLKLGGFMIVPGHRHAQPRTHKRSVSRYFD